MTSLSSPKDIFHLSNRLSFGLSIEDVDTINKMGINSYVKQQLNPQTINVTTSYSSKINQYQQLEMNVAQIFKTYHNQYISASNGNKKGLSEEEKKQLNQKRRDFFNDTLTLKIYRSVNNPRQLEEVMTDFWFNHFTVFARKMLNIQPFLINNYEQKAIKPNVFGKFRDLLGATAQHPAMLYYLDNWQNVIPNQKGKKSGRGLNENYARELMELHTLGVNGGYTQNDVMSLTRILTGWGIINVNTPQNENGFYFNEKLHDYEDKNFLGYKIKGSGIEEVNQALDILASHPATANHISYKLAQFFVANTPPDSLVKKLAKTFLDTEGNLKIVLTKLFESDEFWDRKYYHNQFKTPYQYVISILRIGDIAPPPINAMITRLRDLEMLPYNCITPDGYKVTKDVWLSPDAMIKRVDFASFVTQEKRKNNKNDSFHILKSLTDFFSTKTTTTIKNSEPKWQTALIMGSPEMMYK